MLDSRDEHHLEPRFSVTGNAFAFDDDAVFGDNALPAAPAWIVRGELVYRHASGFFLGPTLDVVGRRYADFANRFRIGGHTLIGLRGGWQARRWRAFFEARNLTDRDHFATHTVRERAAPDARILRPGEPRARYLGLELTL